MCVCISAQCTLSWKLPHLSLLFTAYLEFDTFIPLSSSNGYIVFHVTLYIPARTVEKNYIGRVPPKFSPSLPRAISCHSVSVAGTAPKFRGKGKERNDERRRPWIPRSDEDRCRALAYWQTFSNFTPIWPGAAPVILRLFAPRRVATLYVRR